jgi:peptide deformylase
VPRREILQLGDPRLWTPCAEVADARAPAIATLIGDLRDTLAGFRERSGFGRGIAAPQLGVLARVIFVRLSPTGFTGALVNPRIVEASAERFELWDDCFSFPELMVRVLRALRVKVAYTDEQGAPQTIDAERDLSELLQHEIDHLDGVTATQRALSPEALCTRAEWERRYR